MVVAPSFAYLHHHLRRWQWVFGATAPHAGKSEQNVMVSDILATARL
jgi:hypothetical protein